MSPTKTKRPKNPASLAQPINSGPGARLASRRFLQTEDGKPGASNSMSPSIANSMRNLDIGATGAMKSPSTSTPKSITEKVFGTSKKKKKGDILEPEEVLSHPGRLKVDVPDSILLMAFSLDAIHRKDESSSSRPVIISCLEAEHPEQNWNYNLFQTQAPLKFVEATGKTATWKPPTLLTAGTWLGNEEATTARRDKKAFMSWTGVLDRVELVNILKRCVNCHGQELQEREIEYGVKMYEALEQSMQRELWDSSYRCAIDLVWRFPNFALAYFKAGLCLALKTRSRSPTKRSNTRDVNGDSSPSSPSKSKAPNGPSSASVAERFTSGIDQAYGGFNNIVKSLDPTQVFQNDGVDNPEQWDSVQTPTTPPLVGLSPAILEEISHFWRCATLIEPQNCHLNGLIDLSLRLCTNLFVSRIHMYRDPGLFPRSLGDAVAFAVLENASR